MRSNDQSVQLEAQVQHENLIECLQQNSLKQGGGGGKVGWGPSKWLPELPGLRKGCRDWESRILRHSSRAKKADQRDI